MNKLLYLFNTNSGDYMNLRDIMSKKLIVCNACDSVSKVSSIMKDNDIGFIPVVNENKVVGVITDRDIVVKIISNNDYECDITNYMTKDIIDVDVDSDFEEVLDVMKKYKVKRVIVTNKNKVVGVVSISDFFNCDIDEYLISTIKEIFEIGPNVHKYESQIDEFYL